MSVINKMLKDLEDRSASTNEAGAVHSAVPVAQKSNTPLFVVVLVVLLFANIVGWFIYKLYSENQSLKQQTNEVVQSQKAEAKISLVEMPAPPAKQAISSEQTNPDKQKAVAETVKPFDKPKPLASAQVAKNLLEKTNEGASEKSNKPLPQLSKPIINDKSTEQNKPEQIAQTKSKPVMKIERKQLSPQELAAKKMAKAERAIIENDTQQAEKLFEEVLILVPDHQIARKQLAALWYGRKAYRPALNLLQQGLAIDSNNSDFRLMKARIYLTQGQVAPAFDVLSVLQNTQDIEYQSLLANAAQQLQNFSAAEKAYQQLVDLEPQNGRWWLGLGVAQDSNSNFIQAVESYAAAIQQGGISQSAYDFAKQRIAELGE